jgi:uncharacterized repeat protein (TIGR03806 family)
MMNSTFLRIHQIRTMKKITLQRIIHVFAIFWLAYSLSVSHAQAPISNVSPGPWLSLLLLDDTYGLDVRPTNTTCIAPERATAGTAVKLEKPYPNLAAFSQPTKLLQAPGDDSTWYVLEKGGRIRMFADEPNAAEHAIWLDIRSQVNTNSEGGLLGMAFDPDWPQVKEIYLSYTGDPGGPMISYISRFKIADDTILPVAWTEEKIIVVDQDFNNHDGGDIAFGPDGYLYVGFGDGGSGGDPNDRAQDTTRLLGSFLRVDVRGVDWPAPGYTIPPDNPFAENPACGRNANDNDCPEIFAWGFRNPWRWSFDRDTGMLWAGDVGQNQWEEVDVVELGGNYGWDCREGAHDYQPANCSPDELLIEPVAEYSHAVGNSITGGFVYRGNSIQELVGRYVYGDFGSGRVWALQSDGQGGFQAEELLDTGYNIAAFAEDQSGELYIVHFGGTILKLEPVGSTTPDAVPELLTETGCVDGTDPTLPAQGLIPYDINASFWSDDAEKTRYMALPEGRTISIEADHDWTFPTGSVIVKNFKLGGKWIETRLLMRHPDGVWAGYTYEWNDAQTEANRVYGGKTKDISGQSWIYPSESQCLECHTAAAGVALGPETAQLNKAFTYPATGISSNQVLTLDHIGMFASHLSTGADQLPKLADPADSGAPLDSRARAYLHTNCSQCHRPGGPTPSDMDLRYHTTLAETNSCDAIPLNGNLGIADARIVAPGDFSRSVLTERMNRRDIYGMPPLGSNVIDAQGVALINGWIDSIQGCQ